jgi:hypothetical protein
MIPLDVTKSSVPQLFLFFGCGALTLIVAVFASARELALLGLTYLAAPDSTPASFGLIVAPIVVFLCYVIGSIVVLLGYMLIAIFHSRLITQKLDFEVNAIRHGDRGLLHFASGPQADFLPFYAGIGFGLFQVFIQIGAFFSSNLFASFWTVLFFAGVSLTSYIAWRWKINIFLQMCHKIYDGGRRELTQPDACS